MGSEKPIFKVVFQSQGQIVELFAQSVVSSELFGFVEVRDLRFQGRSEVVVDPSAEGLEAEFGQTKRLLLPLPAILRIEEVEVAGSPRVRSAGESGAQIRPFPLPFAPAAKPPKSP